MDLVLPKAGISVPGQSLQVRQFLYRNVRIGLELKTSGLALHWPQSHGEQIQRLVGSLNITNSFTVS